MPVADLRSRFGHVLQRDALDLAARPAWDAFAETMRTDAAAMKSMHEAMVKGGMPTTMPKRMALRRRTMSSRLATMDRTEASMTALYAALAPDQREAFDEMMSGPMGMT